MSRSASVVIPTRVARAEAVAATGNVLRLGFAERARRATRGPDPREEPPPFVGRGRELDALRRALQRASEGNGSLWSITGPAGIGKTRLLGEIARVARQGGFQVRSTVSTWEGQTPLFPFLGLLHDPDPTSPNERPFAENSTGPARSTAGSGRDRRSPPPDLLALDLLEAIDEASNRSPQLILVDDFHRADPDSIRFLKLVARNLSTRRVLLVFSCRAESPVHRTVPRKALDDVVRDLRIAGSLRSLELAGLSEPEMTQLAAALVGQDSRRSGGTAAEASALVRAAGGNPYFLRELLSALLSQRHGRAGLVAGDSARDLPRSIGELLRQRLAELPPEWRSLLASAAIAGEAFRRQDVAAMVGDRGRGTARRLERLVDSGWPIRRSGSDPDSFAFQHALLRRAALELLSRRDRRRRAGKLARFYALHRPQDRESIARLFAESDRPSLGREVVDELIERAVRSNSYASLETYLDWKSASLGTSSRGRSEFHRSFVELLRRIRPNYPAELRLLCDRFLDSAPAEPERSLVAAWKVYALCPVDRQRATELLAEIRREIAGGPAEESREVAIALDLCQIHLWLDRAEAKPALDLAARVYAELSHRPPSLERLIVIQARFNGLVQVNRISEARAWVTRGRRVARSLHLLDTVVGLNLVAESAALEWIEGRIARSAELAVELAERFEAKGAFARAALLWYNAGSSRMSLSDPVGAHEAYLNALRIARRWGLEGMQGSCFVVLGQTAYLLGRPDEAEAFYRRALPLLPSAAQSETFGLLARSGLARILTRRGDLNGAKEHLETAESLGRRTFSWAQPELARAKAEWLHASGDVRGARRLLQRSLARSEDAQQRYQRAETCVALSHLERLEGRFRAADRWIARARDEAALAGPEVNIEALLTQRASDRTPLPAGRGRGSPSSGPHRGAESASSGSVSDRVLRALSRSGAISGGALDCDVVPSGFTQSGLAAHLALPRESFVRGLLRLVDRGAVIQVRRRVEGSGRAQKAYLLTPIGVRWAAERLS